MTHSHPHLSTFPGLKHQKDCLVDATENESVSADKHSAYTAPCVYSHCVNKMSVFRVYFQWRPNEDHMTLNLIPDCYF